MSKKQTKVAIQGVHGSFHELAAQKYFHPDIECIECLTFKNVFDYVINGTSDYGITAIENTVAGTILPNYAMLRDSGVRIIGEVYLRIQQNLIALKAQSIADLKEVHSHPMAILQCQAFFEQHPHIHLVQAEDTAVVARKIAEKQIKHLGAIAGTHVADMYDLQLLAEAIETHKKNFTRFLVIKKSDGSPLNNTKKDVDKATLCFIVAHEKGSLATVLTQLAQHNINLSKIQSMPIVGKEWQYYIHVDMEFDSYNNYQEALTAIRPLLSEIIIMGEYKRGVKEIAAV